jgi:periplasmic divalent cation tolerance protein
MAAEENGTGETGARGSEAEAPLVLALTTESSLERAERLARELVERGLVACVALMPVVSLYRWQGATTRDEEVQLLMKTQGPCLELLHRTVMDLHSYDTPEWITVPAQTRGGYGQWCADQLAVSSLKRGDAPPVPSESPGGEDPAG